MSNIFIDRGTGRMKRESGKAANVGILFAAWLP